MKLGVLDRLALISVLPKESDFLTMRLIRDLHGRVGFSAEEHSSLKFTMDANGNLTWDQGIDKGVDFDWTPAERDLIRAALLEKDRLKQLSFDHLSIYEKFVLERE